MFHKVLIANRGEIAVRIIRAARSLDVSTVAIYADSDQAAQHVQQADEAYGLGEGDLNDTYLNIDKIIDIAQRSGCEAVHPGYGFLSENTAFVSACEQAGITFIGPDSKAIRTMGDKVAARHFAQQAGVPITEGLTGTAEELKQQASTLSYPVLVKAAAGGGGKGMRIVRQADEISEALASTSREAKAYFGDDTVYIEKYLESPRHIEIQLLGDQHGNLVHLYERECSLQRRYQKIIEEAPSPTLTPELREQMGQAAVDLGKAINYTNAGTIEFLLDQDHSFYFLEMNTRVQVEHPVTELTTGIDIVAEQIKIAAGRPLAFTQKDIVQRGHAIECRVYAENPSQNFMPSPGTVTYHRPPLGANLRLDTAVVSSSTIDSRYDPMIGKLIAYGADREQARQSAITALQHYAIHGIDTNISYLMALLMTDDFANNTISTHYCDQHTPGIIERMNDNRSEVNTVAVVAAGLLHSFHRTSATQVAPSVWQEIGFWRHLPMVSVSVDEATTLVEIRQTAPQTYQLTTDNNTHALTEVQVDAGRVSFALNDTAYSAYVSSDDTVSHVTVAGYNFQFKRNDLLDESRFTGSEGEEGRADDHVSAPMPGKVIALNVAEGDQVSHGDVLLVVEAMKMENAITAPRDGEIKEVRVALDDRVDRNVPLILLL